MGTKRHMAFDVRNALAGLHVDGRVLDLFSGMGSVAESLQDIAPVITNDSMSFVGSFSRSRFTNADRSTTARNLVESLLEPFQNQLAMLGSIFAAELAQERFALDGSREDMVAFMSRARHVGNSPARRREARDASSTSGSGHYRLASLYFAAGYVSYRQANELDAIRAAIDSHGHAGDRDWLLSSWLTAASVVLNAPGHTAQFMRPGTAAAHARIMKAWNRSVWDAFAAALELSNPIGSFEWRNENDVFVGDALELINSTSPENLGAVYADPPYTKDQYSRFYHLYETLYKYDFPDSTGAGRNRSDRFSTGFSLKSGVAASFHSLARNVARIDVPLVISYPSEGLLSATGNSVAQIASQYFSKVDVLSIDAQHSSMGGPAGMSTKPAVENLYTCIP